MEKKEGIKVLLVYPNPMMDNLIPMGVSLLSAYLKKAGHKVKLFDTTFYNIGGKRGDAYRERNLEIMPTDLAKFGVHKLESNMYEDFKNLVDRYKPDLIGMSAIEPTYLEGLSLLKCIKEKVIPTIIGGVHATISADKILQEDCIHMVCVGDGEDAMVELANRIRDGKDYSNIKNLWVKKNGKIIKNPLGPLKNLDDLPFQDWEIYDKKRFYKPYLGKTTITAVIETARGCYGCCTFCGNPVLREKYKGQRYVRFKSPKRVVEEVSYIKEKYGVKFINIIDTDLFARSTKEFEKLANQYKTVKIPFWAEGRVATVNERKVKLLNEMGCKGFAFGIESGNEHIRNDILKKGVSNEQIIKAFSFFKNTEILITANNMIGLPYEKRKEIFETIELNRKLLSMNSKLRSSVAIFTPYEGTYLKEVCLKEGYISSDAFAGDYRGNFPLNMPQISRKELMGLHRTFLMYVKFPKEMWPQIKIAEQDDEMFEKLREIYIRKYLIKEGIEKKK